MHAHPRNNLGTRSHRRPLPCALTALAVVSAGVLADATPARSGMRLDAGQARTSDGTPAVLWARDGGADRQWKTT
ncbi:RICIN domain-containing protein [Microbispora hainanensis]|jgi:hypothetical protein|uniref:RICIN domain-containing protein n=1 Tax=Microbispora hainanensis TaxID=568844 RepID=UPI002E299970|nr:hypothetical protein [Microbispora hainanensis]